MLFLCKRLQALPWRYFALRDIVRNALCIKGDFPIELFTQQALSQMTRAERAGLSRQFARRAVNVPLLMRIHSSSPHEL